jgi:putative flippase GtrA
MSQIRTSVLHSLVEFKDTGHAARWQCATQPVEYIGSGSQIPQHFEIFWSYPDMVQRIIRLLPTGFPAFVVVGTVGFAVDATILAILVHGYGWGDYTARLISFAVAVTVTWLLNRRFVFSDSRTTNRRSEYTRYLAVQGTGMAINFLTYGLCIATNETMDRWPVIALAVGSIVALLFNYVGARAFVFTGKQ